MMRRCGVSLLAYVLAAVMLCGCAGKEEAGKENGGGKGSQTVSEGANESDAANEDGTAPEETPSPEPVVFEGQDMDGNTVTSDLFGNSRLTMVNVWATYCNPCLREMPDLGELAGEYDPADFQLYGIISDVQEGAEEADLKKAEELIEKTGAHYPHLLLNESLYYALLTEVTGVPTTFFVDENGVVLGVVLGSKEKSVWKEIIDGLLEEL